MIATAATTITASYGGSSRTADLAIAPEPGCALRDPGAQWLGFSSSRNGSYDVYAIREDGTCLTRVTSDAGDDLFVTWSPAGTLAYASARSGTMRIYVLDFTTGAEVALDVGDLAATSPAFSPDGSTIAFEGHAPGVTALSDVYVVPAAGGTPVNLTGGTTYNAGPAWSPDGRHPLFRLEPNPSLRRLEGALGRGRQHPGHHRVGNPGAARPRPRTAPESPMRAPPRWSSRTSPGPRQERLAWCRASGTVSPRWIAPGRAWSSSRRGTETPSCGCSTWPPAPPSRSSPAVPGSTARPAFAPFP